VDQHRLQSVSVDELAISNMLKLNALVELLDEKGLLGKKSFWSGLSDSERKWRRNERRIELGTQPAAFKKA
jgi:hypothetical protein